MSQKELDEIEVEDLLQFYQKQQDQNERDFKNFDQQIKNLEISQSEIKKLQWEIQDKNLQLERLQELYEETQQSLIEERRNHLQVVSTNDKLKIKLQKKNAQIQYLAAKAQENSFFNDSISATSSSRIKRTRYTSNQQNDPDASFSSEMDAKTQDLIIENETLSLSVETMRIQLDEQKLNFDEMLSSLQLELENIKGTERAKNVEISRQLEESTLRVYNIQSLYRENVKEMLEMRKVLSENKKLIDEDHFIMRSKILSLQNTVKSKEKYIERLLKNQQEDKESEQLEEINQLESRLKQTRAELLNIQSDSEIKEASYKQSISRMELVNEKLQKDLLISRKDHAFYLNSIFAECVKIKKLIVESYQISGKSIAHNDTTSSRMWPADNQNILDYSTRIKPTLDRLDDLMLYIQRCKTGLQSHSKTPGSIPRKMRSIFEIVSKPNSSQTPNRSR